jgi:hypothetical protein
MTPGKDFLSTAVATGLLLFSLAADAEELRDKVVAAFVVNFIKFAEWPNLPEGAPINLCVAANPGIFSILGNFSGKTVIGHRLHVADLKTSQLHRCQALFIGQTHASEQDCEGMQTASQLLSVSDIPDFAGRCGMIGLYEENGLLRFEVNLDNVERSGIRLSSRLLRLARILREDKQ